MGKNKITPEVYRSLVLTHLYVISRKNRIPLTALPNKELRRLGSRLTRIARDGYTSLSVEVDIPADLEGKSTEKKVAMLRETIEANKELLQKERGQPPRSRRKTGFSDHDEPLVEHMEPEISTSVVPKDSF